MHFDTINFKEINNRKLGFDLFYTYMLETGDWSPDINVERWMCDDLKFDYEKRCVLALHHGSTYDGPTESMLADNFPLMTSDVQKEIAFFINNKKRLYFSPDCKYRKLVFPEFLQSVGDSIKPYGTLGGFIKSCYTSDNPKINYINLQKKCFEEWYHFKRMGFWCFAEALLNFTNAPIEPPTMEFAFGKSHRSGWAFCVGRDDLTGDTISAEDIQFLEDSASEYVLELKKKRPDLLYAGFLSLETACCNYKRQHKGSRYAGCYIDEQYTETMQMKKEWPEYDWLWNKYLEGRQKIIPKTLLYENYKNEEGNDAPDAYIKSWNNALKDHGRMPRVEAWFNGTRQYWTELENLPFARKTNRLIFSN